MNTRVKTGWRLYDPIEHSIIDEYAFAKEVNYCAKGINPAVAAEGLMGRKEAVQEAGARTGQAYAQRILPYWIRVYRDYYVKGTPTFIIARRKAQTGNWNEAGALWEQETRNPNGKIAGRACYNMAIISEINGDIDQAIKWAQNAYENYNNRLALNYISILKYRKSNNAILKDQQPG
ncbi:MAG: hypothetical protein NVSMB7_09680 [Chitinophagaceae bacterium]